MADIQKINAGSNIKKAGGVYYAGFSSTATTPSVDENDTVLEVGAQNAGGNVANEWPCTTCIVTSDGVELSQNAAGCFVLPVDASGVSISLTTGSGISGDGSASAPLAVDPDYVNRGVEWLTDTSGAVTVDWSTPPYNKGITLADDATLTFTSPKSEGPLRFIVVQNATGGHSITWPELSGSTPVIETGSAARTVINFFFDGTNYHV